MKTPYDQRRELSIHVHHFGEASSKARLMYGVLLFLFALIMIVSSRINNHPDYLNNAEAPTQIEIAKQAFNSRYSTPSGMIDLVAKQ